MNASPKHPEETPVKASSNRRTTASQSGLAVVLVLIAAYAAVRYWTNPVYVSDPQPSAPVYANQLADKIDPNTADAETLSALPQMGEKRARDLISYRERASRSQKDGIVFRRPLDLLRVPGFGISLSNQMEPFLQFPATAPATVPSD